MLILKLYRNEKLTLSSSKVKVQVHYKKIQLTYQKNINKRLIFNS